MDNPIDVRERPCASCPYRRDVPSGIWSAEEYEKLRTFDGEITDQAAAGAFGVFACHKTPDFLCAGWTGCHNQGENLAMRLHARELHERVWAYESPVPLFGSGAEAAEHGMGDLQSKSPEAEKAISQILRFAGHRIKTLDE